MNFATDWATVFRKTASGLLRDFKHVIYLVGNLQQAHAVLPQQFDFHIHLVGDRGRFLSRIEDRLAALSAEDNKPFPIGICYGLTTSDPVRHPTPDDLIAEADALMDKAKQKIKQQTTSSL